LVCDEIDVSRLAAIRGVVAKESPSLGFCFVARETTRDELFDAPIEVEAEFLVDLAGDSLRRRRQPEYSFQTGPRRL
jgi:hypothetical protein